MTDLNDNDAFPTISNSCSQEHAVPITARPNIEGYQIIKELGQGGMGVVWRAVQLSTHREVALKVMNPGILGSQKAQSRFKREVELTARLKHPNITRVYDSGLHRSLYYYAMELIEGKHIDEYVKQHILTQKQLMELMKIVCEAINHAHQVGVIHRDLKPSNILVTEDGQPHVLDFGLAKAFLESDSGLTVSIDGDMVGTLRYMSPEQAKGQVDLVDVRSDIYSLGVIIYRLLTDRYPYDVTGTALELLYNIENSEPISPRNVVRKIDSDLETILLTTLAKERSGRYQSTADLCYDIESWLEGRPIRVKSVNTLYLLRKIITKHRYTSTVIGLVILIILSFSFISFDLYKSNKKAKQESEQLAERWNAEAASNLIFAQQVTFTLFLQTWRDGRNEEAAGIAGFFAKDSKEKKAAEFLLDEETLEEKKFDFRNAFSDKHPWFVDFIIAEDYLKNGNKQKALEVYQQSYQAIQEIIDDKQLGNERWLIMQIKARLNELSASKRAKESTTKANKGD